jgi:hypothetical protein
MRAARGTAADPSPSVARAVAKAKEARAIGEDSLATFRTVATALGRDPEQLLQAFAASWLNALRERVED